VLQPVLLLLALLQEDVVQPRDRFALLGMSARVFGLVALGLFFLFLLYFLFFLLILLFFLLFYFVLLLFSL